MESILGFIGASFQSVICDDMRVTNDTLHKCRPAPQAQGFAEKACRSSLAEMGAAHFSDIYSTLHAIICGMVHSLSSVSVNVERYCVVPHTVIVWSISGGVSPLCK